jgi:hypothetical protein
VSLLVESQPAPIFKEKRLDFPGALLFRPSMRLCLLFTCILFVWGNAVWADEETVDIEALLEDGALLDDLLYGAAEVPLESEEEAISWYWENRISLGAGYKRNALFNAFSEESSAFSLSEWESTLIRLASSGDWQFFGYLVAENKHYVDVDGLDDEWMVLALAQAEKPLGDWKVGMAGQYLYLQQAFSLEFEELDLGSTEIALHQFQLTPRIQYALPNDAYLKLSLPLALNRFDDSAQNYEEIGVVAELGKKFSNGGKLTMSYAYEKRDYDERLARTADGVSIAGSSLSWQEHQWDLSWDFHLDDAKRWRSKSLMRYRLVEDDGSGYQDFSMAKLAQTIGYQQEPWGVSLSGSYSYYDYPVQTKTTGDSNQRHRSRLGLGLELERDFGEAWQGFARYDFESYLSNVPEDVYDVHVFALGLRYTF